jgi:hypothetical protein
VDVARDLRVTAGGEQHSAVGVGGMREYREPTIRWDLEGLTSKPHMMRKIRSEEFSL